MWEVDKGTFISRLIRYNSEYKIVTDPNFVVYYVRDDEGFPIYCMTGNMEAIRSVGITIPYYYGSYKFYMVIKSLRMHGNDWEWTFIRNDGRWQLPVEYQNIINAYLDHLEWGINYAMQNYSFKQVLERQAGSRNQMTYDICLETFKWDVFNDINQLCLKFYQLICNYTTLLFNARTRLIRNKSTANFSLEFVPIIWS